MDIDNRIERNIGRMTTINFSSCKLLAIKDKAGYIEKIMKYQGNFLTNFNSVDINFLNY